MEINIVAFGNKLKSIRNELNLTIEEVSFSANINEKTVYRIENGKNKVTNSTLEKLSIVYKRDLIEMYNQLFKNHKEILNVIIHRSEKALYNDDTVGIHKEINELKGLPMKYFSSYEEMFIKYYIKLLEAAYVDLENTNRFESVKLLTKTIKNQIYNFELVNYKNFNFSPIEARILMNLSIMAYNLYKSELSLEILTFILPSLNCDRIIYPKLILNLSTIYHIKEDFGKSLSLVNEGIEFCINNRNFEALSKLFFRKFTSELKLGISNYKDSLQKAIFLAEMSKQDSNKNKFKESAKKIYGVEI